MAKIVLKMSEDFSCPCCGGNMIDIEGHYICQDCEFINGIIVQVPESLNGKGKEKVIE